MLQNISEYLNSWVQKRIDCELQAKGKAKLNNYCWRKLRKYHLQNYLDKIDNPFSLLFDMKYKQKMQKQIEGLNSLYYKELEKRQEKFIQPNDHNHRPCNEQNPVRLTVCRSDRKIKP